MELKDDQWKIIEPMFPRKKPRKDGKGRPPTDFRLALEGILWILRSGARWKDLPREFPPYQTCHRWFQEWQSQGVMKKILRRLAEDLRDRGKLDLTETFIDGSFASAKKGVKKSVKPSGARGPRSWQLRTAQVFLSPYALRALRRMKYDWLKQRSKVDLPARLLIEQSAIRPTTVMTRIREWQSGLERGSLLPIEEDERKSRRRMEESFEDIGVGGELRDFLLGFKITGDS
jgi:transposase